MHKVQRVNYMRSAAAIPAAALLLSACLGAAPNPPTDPRPGIFHEQYYSLYLGQTKCGWAWYQLERKGNEIITRNKMNVRVGREALVLEVKAEGETTETVSGKPLTFFSQMDLAGSKTTYRGRFTGTKVSLQIGQGSQAVNHKFDVPADTVMAWGDYLRIYKYLRQPGTTFTSHSFDPQTSIGKVSPTRVTVHGPATIQVAAREVRGIKVVARCDEVGPFPITTYFDPQGYMIATDMQVGVIRIQLVATSRAEALANVQAKEIFAQSFIRLDRPLKVPSGKPLILRLTTSGAEPLPALPQTTMQKTVKASPKSVILHVLGPGMKRFASPLPKPTSKHLAGSSLVNLSDPLLKKLADQAAGNAKDPVTVANKLCRFVHTYINDKNLASAFAGASEIAKSRSGDCTEHSVLLAALARIKKIPSQTVAGVVYTEQGGPHGAFGYHMWAQLWLGGRWIDMDPTFGQIEPDATHVALAIEDLTDESFYKQAVKLAQFIGQLKVEPVEVKP